MDHEGLWMIVDKSIVGVGRQLIFKMSSEHLTLELQCPYTEICVWTLEFKCEVFTTQSS
jgi:hypothetical protein